MTTGRTLPEPIAESSIPVPAGLKPPAWWPTGDVGAANLAAAREALRR